MTWLTLLRDAGEQATGIRARLDDLWPIGLDARYEP